MAKFCNKCNSPIEEGGVFCTECGSNDIRDDSAVNTEPLTTPVVTTPVTTPVTNPPETTPVVVEEKVSDDVNSNTLVPVVNSQADMPATEPQTEAPTEPETTPVKQEPVMPVEGDELKIPDKVPGPIEDEHKAISFGDVPDYMNGGEQPTTPVVQQEGYVAPAAITTANANAMVRGPKKKSKSKTAIAIIAALAVIFIIVGIVVFVMPDKSVSGEAPFSSDDLKYTGVGKNTFDYTKIFTPQNSFRVGDQAFGFISIPNTWAQFAQTEGNKALQYTDSEDWVVTLYAIPTSQSSAYEYANDIYESVLKSPAEDIKAEKTSLAGYAALSISAYYPEQAKYLTTWFFETKSGYTHYLAIEGPDKKSENYNIIYSFKEDE